MKAQPRARAKTPDGVRKQDLYDMRIIETNGNLKKVGFWCQSFVLNSFIFSINMK